MPAHADDVQKQHDQNKSKQQQVASQLNLAKATDNQVEAEAQRLSHAVDNQRAKVESSRQAQAAAEASVAQATGRINQVKAREDQLRAEMVARSLYAYMHPAGSLFDSLAHSQTIAEAGRRLSLLTHVQATSIKVVDEYKAVRADLAESRKQLESAQAVATARARAAADAEARLQQAEKAKEAAHQELSTRIAELQEETRQLAAAQAHIEAILAARAAQNAAILARGVPPPVKPAAGAVTIPGKAPGKGDANPLGNLGTPSPGGFIWPVHGPVTSEYGPRWGGFHSGIDIGAPAGTPIAAAKGGVVTFAGWDDFGYGNLVLIDHGNGFATAYAHQSRIGSSVGQVVAQGQTVGAVGCTGNCTGDHLHFEIRVNGSAQNPRGYESGGP